MWKDKSQLEQVWWLYGSYLVIKWPHYPTYILTNFQGIFSRKRRDIVKIRRDWISSVRGRLSKYHHQVWQGRENFLSSSTSSLKIFVRCVSPLWMLGCHNNNDYWCISVLLCRDQPIFHNSKFVRLLCWIKDRAKILGGRDISFEYSDWWFISGLSDITLLCPHPLVSVNYPTANYYQTQKCKNSLFCMNQQTVSMQSVQSGLFRRFQLFSSLSNWTIRESHSLITDHSYS